MSKFNTGKANNLTMKTRAFGFHISGQCTCDQGYVGNDCGFDLNEEISDTFINNHGLCNTRERDCSSAPVGGFGFIPDVTKCFVQRAEVRSCINIHNE